MQEGEAESQTRKAGRLMRLVAVEDGVSVDILPDVNS